MTFHGVIADGYRRYGKRLLDVAFAGAGLVLASPVFALAAIAIKVDSDGPVFYSQERTGQHGRSFRVLKFRTMLPLDKSLAPDGNPMPNYDRVTRVGRLLRRTSVDELPQLLNVMSGKMSLVGPRPTLTYQAERYTQRQRRRLEVKPGITGLAQVNGRNKLSWGEKIDLDLQYVDNVTPLGDFKIILRTLLTLFESDSVEFRRHDDLSKHEGDYRADLG